ncbi:YkvA family protein [Catelliglobosispora koreensis]|jgi:uncharacterized membrane protein YkvA (DUF1232 family)|uniref:YkvA family protein n=1 Tax=Catelliglobosispora koreensis TaxID=129052 RepID=UPI0003823D32|nr:YkvA family protein [Catelliglobosispora koreensis]
MAQTLRRAAALKAIWNALTKSGGPSLGKRLVSMPRMFWYSVTGRYDGLGRLVLITAATAYVASPIDLFPEIVLLLPGLIDDAVVVAWIAGAILSETERFLLWEQGRTVKPVRVVDGEVA